ncbi:MAG: glutathione S-transferase family protein [Pseudomonadota bacterium]|nr:glutathione S-transferase family protein [Pseudomonadota bacterium]
MIELFHWEPNTFSLKPLVVLHEKGLEFASRYTNFQDPAYTIVAPGGSETELTHNPELTGPVLVDRGTAMTESFFLSLYLDEAYPERPLRPADAKGRWRVLMWARYVNEVLTPAICTLGCKAFLVPELKKRERAPLEAAIAALPTLERRNAWLDALNDRYPSDLLEDSRRKIAQSVAKIEAALGERPWLAGDEYSLADIDAYALAAPIRVLAPRLLTAESAPRMLKWLDAISERPAVKAALATSKTGTPHEAFAPGAEHSRWG